MNASGSDASVYAPEKKRPCGNCENVLKFWRGAFEVPKQAVILASGSFLSDAGSFHVLDVEARTVTWYETRLARNPTRLVVGSSQKIMLEPNDFAGLLETSNAIWRLPGALPSRLATDVTWDIVLIDGDAVRRDSGMGLPEGLGAELERRLRGR